MRKRIVFSVAALIAVLATPGCKESPTTPSPTTPSPTTPPEFEPGPLGAVTLEAGEAVRIRMLLSVTVAPSLGAVSRHGAEFAVEGMGPVHGRQVDLGDPVDTSCSPEGGREGALGIIGDPQVAGVIGTNCSAAAVAASPVISDAGLVMISPSNTSPRLTSDLAGNANPRLSRRLLSRVVQRPPPGTRPLGLRLQPAGAAERGHSSRRRPLHVRPRGGVRRRVFGPRGQSAGPGRNREG